MAQWDKGITLGIGRIPVLTPLGARPGFGAQPCLLYKALSDLQVKLQ